MTKKRSDVARIETGIRNLDEHKIRAKGTRRLVLDSVSHMAENVPPEELRQLLYALVVRFKLRAVTSLFTLESNSLYATDTRVKDITPENEKS